MKDQRHKRKEIYSVLMVSNTDGKSKQFQVSAFTLRFCAAFVIFLCLVIGWLIYQASVADGAQQVLRQEAASLKEQLQQLETEKEALTKDKLTLAAENEALQQRVEAAEAPEEVPEEETSEEEEESPVPDLYPSDGVGMQKTSYSDEQPYISISAYTDAHIVAAGNGTVTAVSSDDTYAHIIEVEHESGYTTRYLLHQDAEVNTEEGAQVQAGDSLMTITSDDCQLDYQVLLNGEPIDPLTIIDAKG
ncbi:MAG: peptidoglycan DD-metalloendopeptidase family protein [Lachnospiraceae bacterium]|nr:peptidoglycan DD-metalloendopeptidase family protein [Lachnospiraceae bacterium]